MSKGCYFRKHRCFVNWADYNHCGRILHDLRIDLSDNGDYACLVCPTMQLTVSPFRSTTVGVSVVSQIFLRIVVFPALAFPMMRIRKLGMRERISAIARSAMSLGLIRIVGRLDLENLCLSVGDWFTSASCSHWSSDLYASAGKRWELSNPKRIPRLALVKMLVVSVTYIHTSSLKGGTQRKTLA